MKSSTPQQTKKNGIPQTITTRMAPSPTGPFHVGGVRTALYNYLFARKHGGCFVLRIEDTDRERSKTEFELQIKEVFSWLGIEYDDYVRQSERSSLYKKHIEQLISSNRAYISEEKPSDEDIAEAEKIGKKLRNSVIRLRNPGKIVTFTDEILGSISVDTADLGDFIIARDITEPVYHFAVVVDDFNMTITHVIRAQEHLSNTPRQILIHEALNIEHPIYAHIPFILAPDGKKKLSKRDGDVTVLDYREKGYLPEALINYLAFIGWNPGGEKELYNLSELVEAFDLSRVQKGGGAFNIDKLRDVNKTYIQKLSSEDFFQHAEKFLTPLLELPGYSDARLAKIIPLIRERICAFGDISTDIETGEYVYFFDTKENLNYSASDLIWKTSTQESTAHHMHKAIQLFMSLSENLWSSETIKDTVWEYAESVGKGDVLWPLRYALTGKAKSPDPFTCADILGKEETIQRLQKALHVLQSNS